MVFCVILPGKPVVSICGFAQMDTNRWVLPLDNASAINEVIVFLSNPLAPEVGLAVYIAAPPFELRQWHYLGFVHNEVPSACFKPRYVWSESDAMPTSAQIGVELLPLSTLSVRVPEMASNEVIEVAKLIAKDLVRFIQSFDGRLPNDALANWLKRFSERCARQGIDWLQNKG